ncbi:MAG TPA: hypothetical protein VI032_10490 [Burkholderiaceae bacterium]
MSDVLGVLGALSVLVIPLLLAWLLLRRGDRPRPRRKVDADREKMTR